MIRAEIEVERWNRLVPIGSRVRYKMFVTDRYYEFVTEEPAKISHGSAILWNPLFNHFLILNSCTPFVGGRWTLLV